MSTTFFRFFTNYTNRQRKEMTANSPEVREVLQWFETAYFEYSEADANLAENFKNELVCYLTNPTYSQYQVITVANSIFDALTHK